MKRILIGCLVLFAGASLLSSCSITQGSVVPTSHYVYPNSNVTPLGRTYSEVKKFGFLFPPRFRARDLDRLYGDAMSRHQGSDILIDSKVDSRNTFVFIFHFMKVTIEGTAAKMEVGKQDIGQPGFVRNNDQVVSQPQTNQPAENTVGQQQQAQNTQPQVIQPQVTNALPPREEKVRKERQPSKPARLFLQADYVKRDFVKPGFGIGGEFFLGGKVFALAPSINLFSSQRLDLGYAMGTFEAKQTAIWFDQHYYFVNNQVGVYGLTTITYENTKFDKFDAGSMFTSDHALGGGFGLGVSGEFLKGHLVPFLELRYIALGAFGFEAEMNPYWSPHNGRLSWGLKYSFKGSE